MTSAMADTTWRHVMVGFVYQPIVAFGKPLMEFASVMPHCVAMLDSTVVIG